MLQIANTKVYSDIRQIPAWNYFHFYMYNRVASVNYPLLFQQPEATINAIIERVRFLKDNKSNEEFDKLEDYLENIKMGYVDSFMGTNPAYFAYACLIAKVQDEQGEWKPFEVDAIDEEGMIDTMMGEVKALPFLAMIEELRGISDRYAMQMQMNFPELFTQAEGEKGYSVKMVVNQIAQIDFDKDVDGKQREAIFWNIKKMFLQAQDSIKINPRDPNSFYTQHISQFTHHYMSLGYSEKDLKEVSIHDFYAKSRKAKQDYERQQERIRNMGKK